MDERNLNRKTRSSRMHYYLHKTVSPKNGYLIGLVVVSLFAMASYISYAMFTVYEERQRVLSMQAASMNVLITSNELDETKSVEIPAKGSRIVQLKLMNSSQRDVKADLNWIGEGVSVAYLNKATEIIGNAEGDFTMEPGTTKKVVIAITNPTDSNQKVTLGTDFGLSTAALEGTNNVVVNRTDNPYIENTIAYKLKDDTKYETDNWSYSIPTITSVNNNTYKGLYVSGKDDKNNDYTCPKDMTSSNKNEFGIEDLSICTIEENKACPNDTFKYNYKGTDTCIPYTKNRDNTIELISQADENSNFTYIYRGGLPYDDATKNYVKFADKTWTVERIQNDGSLKLVLNDEYYSTTAGYNLVEGYKNSSVKAELNNWYNNNIAAYESFVVDTTTCEDFSTDENSEAYNLFKDETKNVYGFTNRLKELNKSLTATSASPSLLCKDENKIKEKVGTLSIDELFLIGNATTTLSKNKNGMNAVSYNYLMNTKDETFFTTSPSINNEYYIGQIGVGTTIISDTNNSQHALLPTITIKGGILYTSGNGTYKDPYVIS